eukprot:TRINITY_DN10316_c0_g1_i2.p1 TRINITY_DN10316_c0_g1~~TRINITY_DN10316_c0_g1_i2.p1  ORF type:complete len:152 (-),score=56.31 TRINITY_DN10316_c0_g1_i2:68-523(-)
MGKKSAKENKEIMQQLAVAQQMVESNLVNLERQLYALEDNYLVSTKATGNVITGWDALVNKNVVTGSLKKNPNQPTTVSIRNEDRIFSNSSTTTIQSLNAIYKPVQTTSSSSSSKKKTKREQDEDDEDEEINIVDDEKPITKKPAKKKRKR